MAQVYISTGNFVDIEIEKGPKVEFEFRGSLTIANLDFLELCLFLLMIVDSSSTSIFALWPFLGCRMGQRRVDQRMAILNFDLIERKR